MRWELKEVVGVRMRIRGLVDVPKLNFKSSHLTNSVMSSLLSLERTRLCYINTDHKISMSDFS